VAAFDRGAITGPIGLEETVDMGEDFRFVVSAVDFAGQCRRHGSASS
jgi:hypothetical protein